MTTALWIPINGHEHLPLGEWLVTLDGPSIQTDSCVAIAQVVSSGTGGKAVIIDGNFYFDQPKVIAYAPQPAAYVEVSDATHQ